MKATYFKSAIGILLFYAASCSLVADENIDFARDIRPILSDTCFKCHGPDSEERQADLRLDTKTGIFDEGQVVEPGNLADSELYQRVVSDDAKLLMPPPESGRTLTASQVEKIRKWIEQGASYQNHWSFESIVKPKIPEHKEAQNEIDHFVVEKLKQNKLQPNPAADRPTLIRRVSFDLTGLPPSPELLKKYASSTTPNWYETLVDELLATEHYGEHMARFWLDIARYGDTHGLHLDNYRENWLYRDWIINAFNDNKAFDQFTIEQLAGDLLKDPTDEQLIATGFNRSHVTTNEGGSIKDEVYVRNVVDRISTTGTVFMGLTIGCAQCHDHKYDPISQRNFYEMFAFFNSLDANPMDGNRKDHAPILRKMNPEQKKRLEEFAASIKALDEKLKKTIEEFDYQEPEGEGADIILEEPEEYTWIDDEIPPGGSQEGNWKYTKPNSKFIRKGKKSRVQAPKNFEQHFFDNVTIPLQVAKGDLFFSYVYIDPKNPPKEIMLQFNDGNWEHRAYWGENLINWGADKTASRFYMGKIPEAGKWVRLEVPAETVGFENLTEVKGLAFSQQEGRVYWDDAGIVSKRRQGVGLRSLNAWIAVQQEQKAKGLPGPIKKIFAVDAEKWNESQRKKVKRHFIENVFADSVALLAGIREERKKTVTARDQLQNKLPTTLIWKEKAKPTPAYILNRGEYDKKGDEVQRKALIELAPWPQDAPLNRLGFAQWLLSDAHPLMARVTVNRFWQQIFGRGIVETSEDFGAQGSVPSHPELLDWLASDFRENGWNVKRLMKQMVMSSTYQQSSKGTADSYRLDPNNQWLGRGARFRLDAEVLRDQALAVSGLLVRTMGGPGVKPPQPDGLWFVVGYTDSNTVRFKKDSGNEKVHRRSIYTFWKRTAPPPQMNMFDAPSRESCSVRRERTNTPLQALLLMNDPQYIEAARYLAQRTLGTAESEDARRIRQMYLWAMSKEPSDKTRSLLLKTLEANRKEFHANVSAAKELIKIGEVVASDEYDPVELASWTMVANLIMNMDEFISKN